MNTRDYERVMIMLRECQEAAKAEKFGHADKSSHDFWKGATDALEVFENLFKKEFCHK